MMWFETDEIIVRTFETRDWRDALDMNLRKEQGPFAHCEDWFPTTQPRTREMIAYFIDRRNFMVVERRRLKGFACFVMFDGIDVDHVHDILLIPHYDHIQDAFIVGGVAIIYDYLFRAFPIDAIRAFCAAGNEERRWILDALGMQIASTRRVNSFSPENYGAPPQFEEWVFMITRARWTDLAMPLPQTHRPISYRAE